MSWLLPSLRRAVYGLTAATAIGACSSSNFTGADKKNTAATKSPASTSGSGPSETAEPQSIAVSVGEANALKVLLPGTVGEIATAVSSDPSVATVGPDGTVTGEKPGTATLTITFKDGHTARVVVKVTDPSDVKDEGSTGSVSVDSVVNQATLDGLAKLTIPEVGSTKTSEGKACVFANVSWHREDEALNAAAFRTYSAKCPAANPVLMNVAVIPACYSEQWAAARVEVNTTPVGGSCTLRFSEDNEGLTAEDKAAHRSDCAKLGQDPDIAGCQLLCCKL